MSAAQASVPGAKYLEPGYYMDSDHLAVINWTKAHCSPSGTLKDRIVELYYAVRDGFRYDPYRVDLSPEAMKASHLTTRNHGYCIEKANLLGACARVLGIPSRLGFANVRNHIGTEKLEKLLQTDVLVFHGYVEFLMDDKWVKATPAFNRELCDLMGLPPLEFDGHTDSIFQQYDKKGGRFMEYLVDHGTFADWPRNLFIDELHAHYGHLFHKLTGTTHLNEATD